MTHPIPPAGNASRKIERACYLYQTRPDSYEVARAEGIGPADYRDGVRLALSRQRQVKTMERSR